jgi:heme/copper-type cytochrome/quinol oxidase subunit 4
MSDEQRKFQPRVEAEEGDPTRGDFIIAGVIAVVVIAGILWAMGLVNWPH